MGKTYKKQSHRYDDEGFSGRSGKQAKHASGRKTGGMRTLNSYAEDYDEYEDYFDDEFELDDEITLKHTKNTN